MESIWSLLQDFGPFVGPALIGMVGWLIKTIKDGLDEWKDGQVKQNEAIVEITANLGWVQKYREESRKEMDLAWERIDRHGQATNELGSRVTRVEADLENLKKERPSND